MIDSELERLLFEEPAPRIEFHPIATYSRQGDCIEFLISDESFRAERIDSLVTVYYGRESKEVVGSLIKGVSHFIKDTLGTYPELQIDIEGGRVKLVHLFKAGIRVSAKSQSETKFLVYQVLKHAAEKNNAEVEWTGCLA